MVDGTTRNGIINKPVVIAEIGVNYYDIANKENLTPYEAAKLMILKAKGAGADIVKFQTYKAEKLAAKNSPAYWDLNEEPTTSQRILFGKYDKLTLTEYEKLAQYCGKMKIEFLTTAFDPESAEAINQLVKRHKIASADITNLELLRLIASFKKPIILSTGASTKDEITYALNILHNEGANDISLLHCVLSYPTPIDKANLWKIEKMREIYPNHKIGYSDHTKFDIDVLSTAWLMGSEIIEKHFTLDKRLKGNDHYHAADPIDLKHLNEYFEKTIKMLGNEKSDWYDSCEEKSRIQARRGVFLKKDVKRGERLKETDVEFLRPQGDGISPVEFYHDLMANAKYSVNIANSMQLVSSHIS